MKYVIIIFQDKKSRDIYFEDLDIISGKDFGLRAKFAADQTEATETIDNFQINAKGKANIVIFIGGLRLEPVICC